jgi:glycerol-3-phosphate acyltransferase PlsY
MMDMTLLLLIVVSYLIGSIPSGLILGKQIWNTDLREHGSHNIGATNAFRTLGKNAALLIFSCDAIKGAFGVWLGGYLLDTPLALVIGGICAIIGHNWPIFLGFKGGRGVATGLGVIAMLVPTITLIVFATWALIVYVTRYVSLGSVVAAACVPVWMVVFGEQTEIIVFGIIAALFVIIRHRPNIVRLLNGTESKIKSGKK